MPVHPEYQAILALQDVAHLKAVGDTQGALQRLREAHAASPGALGVGVELVRELTSKNDIHGAEDVYRQFVGSNPTANPAPFITLIATALLDAGKHSEAVNWLDRLPMMDAVDDAVDAAIQEKRAGRLEKAHRYFQVAGDTVLQDVKALHEFAQVKIKLADKVRPRQRTGNRITYLRLLDEAREMLQRVVQMDAPRTRRAWAWYDLGRVLRWTGKPRQDIHHAFEKAEELDPAEPRFSQALRALDNRTT